MAAHPTAHRNSEHRDVTPTPNVAEYLAQQADEAQYLGAEQTSTGTGLTDDELPEVEENGMIVIKQKGKSAQTTYDRITDTSAIQYNNGKDVPPTDYLACRQSEDTESPDCRLQ